MMKRGPWECHAMGAASSLFSIVHSVSYSTYSTLYTVPYNRYCNFSILRIHGNTVSDKCKSVSLFFYLQLWEEKTRLSWVSLAQVQQHKTTSPAFLTFHCPLLPWSGLTFFQVQPLIAFRQSYLSACKILYTPPTQQKQNSSEIYLSPPVPATLLTYIYGTHCAPYQSHTWYSSHVKCMKTWRQM